MNVSSRSHATEKRYQKDIEAGSTRDICSIPPLREWKFWKLVPNDYPGDILYKVCHMLIIKEDVSDRINMSEGARLELDRILEEFVYPSYSSIIENCPSIRSAPHVYHLHVVKMYDSRRDMRL